MDAIYPGTFDPITFGHLDIIKRASKIFDKLYISIAENTQKKPLLSLTERKELVTDAINITKIDSNCQIIIDSFSGLLVEYARSKECKVLVRGLRAISDFEYEFQMSCMNSKLASEIQTIFLPASDNMQFISSRFVKQIASLSGDISELVTANTKEKLQEKYK